jgi:hypothetical protein
MLIGAIVPKMKIINCLLANDMPCICQEARTEPLSRTRAGTDSCPPEMETLFYRGEKTLGSRPEPNLGLSNRNQRAKPQLTPRASRAVCSETV